jgi:hypothetical protein
MFAKGSSSSVAACGRTRGRFRAGAAQEAAEASEEGAALVGTVFFLDFGAVEAAVVAHGIVRGIATMEIGVSNGVLLNVALLVVVMVMVVVQGWRGGSNSWFPSVPSLM